MDHWTDGYVTELPYSVNHFPEMTPAHLNLALLHLGLDAPLDAGFTYLELGFGQGLGLNMLAAIHPQGRFFGNDFMPAHVRAAQGLASYAGLHNLSLFEDSFAQLLTRELPLMDYIVLHGVYSWVNAENRNIIVALLRKLLKPAGVVYISYNCLPGWSLKAPMQRLMSEFAEARGVKGSALERFHAARELLGRLDAANAAFFTHNAAARTMLGEIQRASDAYLLHEFAPQGWSPFYHTDVARDLAPAGLCYAGSAKLLANFPEWSQTRETRSLLVDTPDAGLRELLRDFAAQTQFRRDIFARGIEALSATETDARYRALKFSLWRPRASCAMNYRIPVGELKLDEATFGALLDCLASGPQDLDALIGASGLDGSSCIEALNLMLCIEYIGISSIDSPDAQNRARIQRLNCSLLQRVRAGERISGFASPAAGAGIAIPYHDQLFLSAQQDGHVSAEALAAHARQVLDLAATDNETPLAQLQHEARNFLTYGAGFYKRLDLFPPDCG